jgi:CAAX protease family protein
MQFDRSNPNHIIAAIMVLVSISLFIILPIVSFAIPFSDINNIESINELESTSPIIIILAEIFLFMLQILMVVAFFVLVPILWYKLVNNFSTPEILKQIRLSKKNIDQSIIWGTITALLSLGIVAVLSQLLIYLGFATENTSNIQDIELYFSIPLIFLLITFQPIAEEFFFRGFLLDKFTSIRNTNAAIIITSILFGIAHISHGNVIPAILISCIALVFGYAVVKTNNLMTGIIGHILFNVISFLLYLFGKDLITEALIL